MSDADTKQLGLKVQGEHMDLPLHELDVALEKARPRVSLMRQNKPVVPARFDPYRSVLMASVHLLARFAQDLMNSIFKRSCPK